MIYTYPKPLKCGDTIGVISLAGAVENRAEVERGVKVLEGLGFKVKLSSHLYDCNGYLAGHDSDKIEELHSFFKDDSIDCILCSRGGYGSIRIVDDLDYDLIKANPKAFCGYSDITALSAMMLKKSGLVIYSSPMLCGDFGAEKVSEYTIDSFLRAVEGQNLEFVLQGDETLSVKAISFGGNLTTLASLCGRDFMPQEKFVFIIEDINEPVYKIDRALNQLYGLPLFKDNVVAIVLGDFTGLDDVNLFNQMIQEFCNKCNVPYWTGLRFGHNREKITLPIGSICEIKNNKIKF